MRSISHRLAAVVGTGALAVALVACSGGNDAAEAPAQSSTPVAAEADSDPAQGSIAPTAEAGDDTDAAPEAGDVDPESAAGDDTDSAPEAGDDDPEPAAGVEADDSGTVTVVIDSGAHAGSYTRDGNLHCTNFGDGRWIVFAPGEGADDDIASLELYYLPGGIDADHIETPYPGEHAHLNIAFGTPIASGDNRIVMEDGDGGSVDLAVPSFDETMRPVHNFIATTADGVSMTISAAVAECPSY